MGNKVNKNHQKSERWFIGGTRRTGKRRRNKCSYILNKKVHIVWNKCDLELDEDSINLMMLVFLNKYRKQADHFQ